MLAFDHGYIMGPTSGIERIDLSIPPLMEHVDVAIGNEEDADKVLGIKAKGTDVESGQIDPEPLVKPGPGRRRMPKSMRTAPRRGSLE